MESRLGIGTTRMIVGIISIVLFFLVSLYSCGVGFVNAVENNITGSGSAGLIIGILILTAGIISIAARKSLGGAITTACFYLVSAIIGIPFEEIIILSIVSLVLFCVIFISIVFDLAFRFS